MNDIPSKLTHWKKFYAIVSWIGIILNLSLSLPLIFAPHWILGVVRAESNPVTWCQFFGVLLTILSVFYIPAARDVDRYRWFAWAAFASRMAGVIFALYAVVVLGAPDVFLMAVVLDGAIGLLQLVALWNIDRLERGLTRLWPTSIAALALAAVALGIVGWHKFFHEYPQQFDGGAVTDVMEERFNHASIGTEAPQGIPYWIWISLPEIFPDYLPAPGGYSSLGFLWHEGDSLPIGFSRKKIGYDRIGITCAVCHTGAVQVPGEPRPRIYAGGVGNTLNLLGYQQFLFACAHDDRFTAEVIMPVIARKTQLSWLDSLIYRFLLIPGTRKALLEQADRWSWAFEPNRDHWGRGRIEPFNPVKRNVLNIPVGSTLGTSDMQPLWNLADMPKRAYHWDGLNTNLTEVVQSGALGDGATPRSIPLADLDRLEKWLRTRTAPKWPFEQPEAGLVARGAEVYKAQACGKCHDVGGERTGQLTPASEVGTDPNRVQMWTAEAADAYNAYLGSLPWRFKYFRSTDGYLNVQLNGIWARAPYLHNGSVPTLADLFTPPDQRPKVFWRGMTDYDVERVGFVSTGPAAERTGSRYDTALRGNSNAGHTYGTELSGEEKRALIEYLKTL